MSKSIVVRDLDIHYKRYIRLIKRYNLNIAVTVYVTAGMVVYERIPPVITNNYIVEIYKTPLFC